MGKEKNICEACEVHKDIIDSINKNYPSEEVLYDLAEIFKVFGEPTRVKILFVLFETELCVCGIAELLNMNQSTISQQLRILKQAKLVKNRRDGKTIYYSLADSHVKTIFCQALEHITE